MATNENIAARAWRETFNNPANSQDENVAAIAQREYTRAWHQALFNYQTNNQNENAALMAWLDIGYRADREPDASWYRSSNHRPPSHGEIEYRRREEERINKIKSSWKFKVLKIMGRNLYDTEAEADEATLKLIEEKEREIPRNPPPGGWAPFK